MSNDQKKHEEGKDNERRSPITTLLFISVTLALAVKMSLNIPAFRDFFSGYGKLVLLPVLLLLAYIGTHRRG